MVNKPGWDDRREEQVVQGVQVEEIAKQEGLWLQHASEKVFLKQ